MKLTQFFLTAKHWQLFLIVFALPIFAYFIFMFIMMGSMFMQVDPQPEFMFNVMYKFMAIFSIIGIVSYGSLFWWEWAIATQLQSKIPSALQMKVGKFKVFFWIPVVYVLVFTALFVFMFSVMLSFQDEPNPALFGLSFVMIIPVHLFAMFCIFYVMYFVAKTIKTVELQRETTFGDFAGEFFLIWFYPIGIWIIQPKINQWMAEQKDVVRQ